MGTRDREPNRPNWSPVSSRTCGHTVCTECIKRSGRGAQTSLPWLDCPVCRSSYAFNVNQLNSDGTADAPAHYTGAVSAQAPSVDAYPRYPAHYYDPSSTPYYTGSPPSTAFVSPPREALPKRLTQGHAWQTMDYSPLPYREHADDQFLPWDFQPPPPYPGLPSTDIQRQSTHVPPRCSPVPTSTTLHSPVRKRLRVPIARSTEASKAMARQAMSEDKGDDNEEEESSTSRIAPSPTMSSSKQWLNCRICNKPVIVTCQRLLAGPPPDHESLWPQVRLGKRLAAALRQHNQKYHPDVFMWNVKGRTMMSHSNEYMEDDDAVAQAALIKALEASFEHLPHIAGVDDYESKSAFLSRTLRRTGFAYAYISYTSSEWTKWQQWKKDCYSRVQIQAKSRQLLEKYESNLKEAIDDQWPQISSFDHQEKLDLFQNIFVLPQCIFECLNHGRLPMHYGDVTSGDSS